MSAAKGKTLVVLDGMAYAFRSFYAIPPMTDPRGRAVNAVYGFAQSLRRAVRDYAPDFAVVANDSPGGSFRDEMLAEYKGHRDAPPEDLVAQFPLIEELSGLMGWALIKRPRMEADDVMATLAGWGRSRGCEVVLMTSDKDILQLIAPGVRVHRESPKGASLYGPQQVLERFGVEPGQVADLLGLMGDSSDNIPGVPGVGEKTAARLLAEHRTLEAVLAAAPGIKGKVGLNLVAFAEQARLSRRLAALRSDLDLEPEASRSAYGGPKAGPLAAFLRGLGLRSLAKEYAEAAGSPGPEAAAAPPRGSGPEPGAGPAPAAPAVRAWSGRPGPAALRALGLDPELPCAVDLFPGPVPGGGCPTRVLLAQGAAAVQAAPADLKALRGVLAGLRTPVLFQSKPLQRVLLAEGLGPLEGVLDVAVGAWLVHSVAESRDLAEAAALLGVDAGPEGGQPALLDPTLEQSLRAAGTLDAVGRALRGRLDRDGMGTLYDSLEGPLVAVLAGMENAGVRVDAGALEGLDRRAQEEMARLKAQAEEAAGVAFNLNSPTQLADVLFQRLGLEAGRRTKTGLSTDNEVLESLAEDHALPGLVLEHRQLAKLSGTYLKALPRLVAADGRIHCAWNQHATATGRLSSADPNLQNIPVRSDLGKAVRRAFVPQRRGDRILTADYSQVELRVLAHYCGDPLLQRAFLDGRDIHAETAARMHGVAASAVTPAMRARAKVINFGVLYGMGAFRISREFGVGMGEAKAFLRDYFAQFPTVLEFLESCKRDARERGYAVTLLGRRRPIPEIGSANRAVREHGERIATNLPIQGTAADLIKKAMLAVDALLRRRRARTRLIMQVHDELVFELAREEAEDLPRKIQAAMEGALKLDVPLVVDLGVGGNWADAKH